MVWLENVGFRNICVILGKDGFLYSVSSFDSSFIRKYKIKYVTSAWSILSKHYRSLFLFLP